MGMIMYKTPFKLLPVQKEFLKTLESMKGRKDIIIKTSRRPGLNTMLSIFTDETSKKIIKEKKVR